METVSTTLSTAEAEFPASISPETRVELIRAATNIYIYIYICDFVI